MILGNNPASTSKPVLRAFQPWMLDANIYVADDDFLITPAYEDIVYPVAIPEPPVVTNSTVTVYDSSLASSTFSFAIVATGSPTSFTCSGFGSIGSLTFNPATGVLSGSVNIFSDGSGHFNPALNTHVLPISATNAYGTGTGTLTIVMLQGSISINQVTTHNTDPSSFMVTAPYPADFSYTGVDPNYYPQPPFNAYGYFFQNFSARCSGTIPSNVVNTCTFSVTIGVGTTYIQVGSAQLFGATNSLMSFTLSRNEVVLGSATTTTSTTFVQLNASAMPGLVYLGGTYYVVGNPGDVITWQLQNTALGGTNPGNASADFNLTL